MASCKYYDCGYCYAPKDIKSNDVKGACIEPEYCPYLKTQMTEKERIEGEIKILQKKLALIEEIEKTKTPCEEAYKNAYGVYPTNEITYNNMWSVFQKGYYAAQKDYKVGEYQEPEVKKLQEKEWSYKIADEHGETNPYKQYLNSVEDEKKMEELGFVKNSDGNWTAQPLKETAQELVKKLQEKEWDVDVKTNLKPQTPEQVSDGLKEAFKEAQKTKEWKETQKLIDGPWMDDLIEKIKKDPPPFLRFELGSTLEDRIYKWWNTCFVHHPEWSMEECVEDLLDIIELFLPREGSTAGSQDTYACIAVDAENDLLKKIKSKLRNKKDT